MMGAGINRGVQRTRLQMGDDPNSVALQARMNDLANVYQQRRLPMQQARQNALAQTFAQGQPINAALGRMYGDMAPQPFGNPGGSPLPIGYDQIGTPGAYSPLPDPQEPMSAREARRTVRERKRGD